MRVEAKLVGNAVGSLQLTFEHVGTRRSVADVTTFVHDRIPAALGREPEPFWQDPDHRDLLGKVATVNMINRSFHVSRWFSWLRLEVTLETLRARSSANAPAEVRVTLRSSRRCQPAAECALPPQRPAVIPGEPHPAIKMSPATDRAGE